MLKVENGIIEVQENMQVNDVIHKAIKDPYGFIYITTNLINGKRYLGQRRFSQGWQKYLGSGLTFKKALAKYGENNFIKDIILICFSEEELNQAEYDLSVFFNVVESNDWYNLVLGGGTSRGWHPSEETKQKIGIKTKERLAEPTNHPMYGKHLFQGENNPMFGISPKERMDEDTYMQWYDKHKSYWENPSTKGKHIWIDKPHPNLGKEMPDDQKENLSIKAKERFVNPENHPMYGKSQSDFCKERVGDAHRGYKNWNTQPVYSIELDRIFWGAKDAFDEFGFDSSGIIKCCKYKRKSCGKHPTTKENLHWLYARDAVEQGYIAQQKLDDYLNSLKQKGND